MAGADDPEAMEEFRRWTLADRGAARRQAKAKREEAAMAGEPVRRDGGSEAPRRNEAAASETAASRDDAASGDEPAAPKTFSSS